MHIQSTLVNNFVKTLKSNAPELLTAIAVGGVVSTGYLAGKAAVKANRLIEEHDATVGYSTDPKERLQERAKLVWKCYIPPALAGSATIVCIIASYKGSGRRTAAAVAAYSITEKAFSEYKEKVVEQIGENKEQKIRDAIAEDKIKNTPPKGVVLFGSGHVLCCELFTGRYFMSDAETIRKAENSINFVIVNQTYVTMDELYDILGLEPTSQSSYMGWDSDKLLKLEFTSVIAPSGDPCLAFTYNYVKPIH